MPTTAGTELFGQFFRKPLDNFGTIVTRREFVLGSVGQPFELHMTRFKLVGARYDDGLESTPVGVLELLADSFRFRVDLGRDAA